jgi:MFS family permease
MKRRRGILGFSRTVFMLGLVSLCNDLASEMIYPLLPIYLTSLGASVWFIGLVEGTAETTASVLKLFSGWIADRLGHKRLLTVAGYAFSNAVRPLIGLAASGWQVLALRFADRVGKGIRTSPRDALIADNTAPAELGRAFGFSRAMDHGGAMAGSLAAFLLLTYAGAGLSAIFLLSAIPGVLVAVLVLAGVGTSREPVLQATGSPALSLRPFSRRFKAFLLVLAVFALGNSSDAFLLLRAKELGVSVASIPLLWIVFHAVKSFSSTPGGVLSDRFGRPRIVAAGWVVYALVYLGFSAASTALHAWVLFAVYGLYFGLTEGVERAFVADLVLAELRGTAFGVYHLVLGLVALPSSLLAGFLWKQYSSTVALGTGAALAFAAALLLPRLKD